MHTTTQLQALAATVVLAVASPALAQYNAGAGRSAPRETVMVASPAPHGGAPVYHAEVRAPGADQYGNAAGNQYDLARDGAFEGQTVAVLQFYTDEGFDFHLPREALRQKGFSVFRWSNAAPSPAELRTALARANQLWVISGSSPQLNEEHLQAIQAFFNAGHGVYIWGDNEPFYADANVLAHRLFDTSMSGNLLGNQVVGLRTQGAHVGLLDDHLITTGIERLFEGITIATVQPTPALTPLLYGSAGNLVSAFYDHDGRRAIIDGGFTRLYVNWDTAGTARYVKNAASWLANAERFGSAVVAHSTGTTGTPPTVAPTVNPRVTPAPVAPTRQPTAPPVHTSNPVDPLGLNTAPTSPRHSVNWSMLGGLAALALALGFARDRTPRR